VCVCVSECVQSVKYIVCTEYTERYRIDKVATIQTWIYKDGHLGKKKKKKKKKRLHDKRKITQI